MDEQGQPEPLSRLSFFIPMRDVTPENGSTEIWVGSHNDLCWVPGQKLREKNPNPGQPDAETQEAQRGRLPPTQVSLPKGAVLLRDARGWHRGQRPSSATYTVDCCCPARPEACSCLGLGMSNRSDQPRHLLTVAYVS